MDVIPNEIIEHIYNNLNANDSSMLSMASKAINECRPDYSYEKHKTLFSKVLAEITNIEYFIVDKSNRFDNREYKFDGYFGNPGMIRYVNEPSIYSIRKINGRTTATATFADTMKSKKSKKNSEFNFRYTVEIYSDKESSGEQKFSYQRATWKMQGGLSKFFRDDDFVYVYLYTDTRTTILEK